MQDVALNAGTFRGAGGCQKSKRGLLYGQREIFALNSLLPTTARGRDVKSRSTYQTASKELLR